MSVIFAPLFQAATYARWLHLLIGLVAAGVVILVYPGTEGVSTARAVLVGGGLCAALLSAAALLLPAVRRAEGVQARLLLMPEREESIGASSSASWADRGRTAGWLVARVALGTAVGLLAMRVIAAVMGLLVPPVGVGLLLVPVLLFALGWAVVLAGRLQLALAVRLLGPSAAERLAEAELRAERLLERNRLARELHDSIGHALTVTVLQAGAAREVADEAFRDRALEAIETTGRRAMEDLERMLVLLRDTPEAAATEQPGIDQAPALFDTARGTGSPIEARIEVRGAQLPGVLSREAYRILQESVTNALKHAPGAPVTVGAALRDGWLELRCANARTANPRTANPRTANARTANPRTFGGRRGGGKGLRGIRERASLLGGEAVTGEEDGQWVVRVRLPLRLGE